MSDGIYSNPHKGLQAHVVGPFTSGGESLLTPLWLEMPQTLVITTAFARIHRYGALYKAGSLNTAGSSFLS